MGSKSWWIIYGITRHCWIETSSFSSCSQRYIPRKKDFILSLFSDVINSLLINLLFGFLLISYLTSSFPYMQPVFACLLPKEESSLHLPACNKSYGWFENMPIFHYPEVSVKFSVIYSAAGTHPDCPTIHSYLCRYADGKDVPSAWQSPQTLTASPRMFRLQYLLFPLLYIFYLKSNITFSVIFQNYNYSA